MKERFANIIIDIAHEKVDRPFTYAIPDILQEDLEIGSTVIIPFGRGNQTRTGFVIEKIDRIDIPREKIKDIIEIARENVIIEARQIKLAAWMRNKYGSTMTQALKTVLPVKSKVKPVTKYTVELLLDQEQAADFLHICEKKHFTAKARLVKQLMVDKKVPKLWITKFLNISAQTIQSLERNQVIRVTSQQTYRNPFAEQEVNKIVKDLNVEQEKVTNEIWNARKENQFFHMIKGVTGSGKTEVYIELISRTIKEGKQAIVLIPEIALTYQTVRRFRERFGDQVTIMNSKLSPGERHDQMERAKCGQVSVMIGPRSALFTPFPNLGIIVIDEEHEASYKSENLPRYHAREVAKKIVEDIDALLVLGSATPSIDTYYAYKKKEIQGHFLEERYSNRALPKVYIKDLRQELKNGNRSIFSEMLQAKIEERLEKKEQIMLFINRRGYAGFVSCRACGHVMKCPHCDVSLSEHADGKLKCHYCGYEIEKVNKCPECGSNYISGFRAGTQQIVDKLQVMYPTARILRMDADTTKRKDSYEKILSSFSNEEADILVGTQMIVKGHDFPKVTLVGILAADLSLSLSDFRAGEKTFQLLTQAAGRAGRGERPGEVVIQTYQPEHYSIIHAAAQDYESFYDEELIYRTMCNYPPVGHLLSVQVQSKYETSAEDMAQILSQTVKEYCMINKILILGPAVAKISKIKDYYRYGFYLKAKDEEKILECKERIENLYNNKMDHRCLLQFDFDPIQIF